MVAENTLDLADQDEPVNIGAGKGNLSTVNLYAEKNVIKKIPVTEPSKLLASPIRRERFQAMHNTEVLIYNILQNHPEANISHPKIYETLEMDLENDITGHITMEYISNCYHVFLFENLEVEHLIEPIQQVARFHSIKLTAEEREKVPKNMLTTWMAELFCDLNMAQFMTPWRTAMKNYMTPETLKLTEILPKIITLDNLQKFNDDVNLPQFLCHGDFWPANILFEEGNRKFKAICDYQCANIGNGMQDLARLLATSLSGENRRENTKYLLEVYHKELQKHQENPVDFEKIEKSFEIFMVFHGAVVCITSVGRTLMRINEAPDEETKNKISEAMCEKYTLLLEDVNVYWQKHFNQSTIR